MPQVLSYAPKHTGGGITTKDTRHVLVYFISGNPGLIHYYEPFLSTLHSLLEETPSPHRTKPVSFHVYGRDLAGFDDADQEPFGPENPPHDVESQIRYALEGIDTLEVQTDGPRKGSRFDRIIVIGHSVGAYITLEAFHRRLKATAAASATPRSASLASQTKISGDAAETSDAPDSEKKVEPVAAAAIAEEAAETLPVPTAGILLFPTVSHIAESPSGRRLSLLRSAPLLGRHAHRVAKAAADAAPDWALRWALRRVLGFSEHAAAATTRFLRSRDGIFQALHLGVDEMRVIGEEEWGEELWEVAEETEDMAAAVGSARSTEDEASKFVFYFGRGDHWVSDEHRERFIERRNEHAAREGPRHKRGRTRVLIDEENIPHAFCIRE